jgi:23S rRNA (cytidine1920-2'-O)/16S rRNA (cytidine1409-2'-O)-methyltransferase
MVSVSEVTFSPALRRAGARRVPGRDGRIAGRVRSSLAPMAKTRLDALLVERGIYESRSRAAAAVLAGEVRLERPGDGLPKPGQMVSADLDVHVERGPSFVSRGGLKLANALDTFGLDPAGRRCLDVGASTGGFTDCLLVRGAESVVAVDVAYGELSWRLRGDPRITVLERTNARSLRPELLPHVPDLAVVDVSFISLAKVLGPTMACLGARYDVLALVKPQFELGRERVGRGGVVRAAGDRRDAFVGVARRARDELGYAVLGFASSGLPGPAGNRESFVWLSERGRTGEVADLEAAARSAEP